MPNKKIVKVITIIRKEFSDGTFQEEIKVTESQTVSVSYPTSARTIDVSPLVGKSDPESEK